MELYPAFERAVASTDLAPWARHVAEVLDAAALDEVVLSQREREIVRYLPTTLSTAEIASRLYISLNTVKTHLRSIYRKLDVKGRREAVEEAERLGLV